MMKSIAIPHTNDVLTEADTQYCPTDVISIIKLVTYQRKKLKKTKYMEGYKTSFLERILKIRGAAG